ncbi:MAG TPA: hypothetical protein VGS07_22675 [Thermoanaerobaculia bacterium]|jgi:hypothetical protein|nr:hypothetical protein [Thermoanaerobaculia bacterium]
MPSQADLVWAHDLLLSKARTYAERAFDEPRDSSAFPFWASLALELLGRAALAFIHPALLADTERDRSSIIYAFGIAPKTKNFVPRSITITEVFARCEQIVTGFTSDLQIFCAGLTGRRNEELHSGALPFENFPNRLWLPRFYSTCKVLLEFQKLSLEDLLGTDDARAADTMLTALADENAKQVRQKISAHAQVWESKPDDARDALKEQAEEDASPWKGHVVDCPACGCKALVIGEDIKQLPPRLEEEVLVVRQVKLPTKFLCTACGLAIEGHSQLHAADLGSQFTSTSTFDPIDYYAPDEPIQDYGASRFCVGDR